MNFFEHQASARRRTSWYVALFALATLGIVLAVNLVVLAAFAFWLDEARAVASLKASFSANPQIVLWTTLVTLSVIGGASLYRILSLSGGGGKVAAEVGGTLVDASTKDPQLRQLVNIVEEMAIASGIPVPQVYVLEDESGINAFAAGYSPSDAAIAVTRGALTHFTRDELQGVIGHEFSHLLNGDMRLNTRLIGTLFGILAIGVTGRLILRHMRGRGRDAAGLLAVGIALLVIGYVGLLFGRMIQAAVSRSRESLADASAVQFTRNPAGLAGALKKVAALSGQIEAPKADQVSHMFFASAVSSGFGGWFATHPPMLERIRAIDPYFRPSELKRVARAPAPETAASALPENVAALAPASASPGAVVASVGQVSGAALLHAARQRAGIPMSLMDAAHATSDVVPVVLALTLGHGAEVRARQMNLLRTQTGVADGTVARVEALATDVVQLDPAQRLPLFEIAFPALRQHTPDELRTLASLVDKLAAADGELDTFEYALTRLLRLQLYEVLAPRARRTPTVTPKLYALRAEVQALFSVLARTGVNDMAAARAAYADGVKRLLPMPLPEYVPTATWDALDRALVRLDFLAPSVKEELIKALVSTVFHDGQPSLAEAELLRVICASLHCPLPPLAASGVDVAVVSKTA